MRPSPILLKRLSLHWRKSGRGDCAGEVSTGAYSDLKQANGIARSMITKYGMSDTLGNLVFANESDEVFIGRDLSRQKTTVRR